MPVPFSDFGADSAALFSDHHQAGEVRFSKAGAVGAAGSTYELSANTDINGGKSVDWNLAINAGSMKIEHDHTGAIRKELNFNVKQVPGLTAAWKPSFSQANGLAFGNLNVNYANAKANLNLNLALPTPNNADFELSVAPFNGHMQKLNLGVAGNLSASGLQNASWGYHATMGDVQLAFKSNDLSNIFAGTCSVYQALPNNKYFCCYGMETDKSSRLAIAAATGCCKTGTRFSLDQAGTFNVARVQQLNSVVGLNVSGSVNLANIQNGGHKVGFGLSFN